MKAKKQQHGGVPQLTCHATNHLTASQLNLKGQNSFYGELMVNAKRTQNKNTEN